MIIAGRCDRTFSIVSQRTALIRETVEAVVTENELIEEPDSQEVSPLSQLCDKRPILGIGSPNG